MHKLLIKIIYSFAFIISCITLNLDLQAKKRSFGLKKSYTPKAAYAGFGKVSTSTGHYKTKSVHGYYKPSNGYKFVNPYARSK